MCPGIVPPLYMRIFLLVGTLAILSGIAWPPLLLAQQADSLGIVGVIYPPLPDGYVDEGGGLFSDEDTTAHAIGFIEGSSGTLVVLKRKVKTSEQPEARWEILAAMPYPETDSSQTVIVLFCKLDGELDPEVIAVVDYEPGVQELTVVHRAWRADRSAGAFESMPVGGVTCINESYGL